MGTLVKLESVLVTFLNILTLVSTEICQGTLGEYCCFGYKMHPVERICIPCELGYTGVNCGIKCPFPSYGSECQMKCTCKEEYCDFVKGCTSSLDVSSKSHKDKNEDIITGIFNNNDGGFNTTLIRDGDNAYYKKDNDPQTKRNISDGLMHAVIGLAIVAFFPDSYTLFVHLSTRQLSTTLQ